MNPGDLVLVEYLEVFEAEHPEVFVVFPGVLKNAELLGVLEEMGQPVEAQFPAELQAVLPPGHTAFEISYLVLFATVVLTVQAVALGLVAFEVVHLGH